MREKFRSLKTKKGKGTKVNGEVKTVQPKIRIKKDQHFYNNYFKLRSRGINKAHKMENRIKTASEKLQIAIPNSICCRNHQSDTKHAKNDLTIS